MLDLGGHHAPNVLLFIAKVVDQKLAHIPPAKVEELKKIAELLAPIKLVEMVILYGSYARGSWVEDRYIEDDTIYEYRSDFDLLVVFAHEDFKQKFRIEDKVKAQLIDTGEVSTPISLIFHGIKPLNQSLMMGNYFFKDIRQEGIALYDSEKFKLAAPSKLTADQYRQKAQDYFDQWFESANEFLKYYNYALKDQSYHKAAFFLHQATEGFFTTILLVFTDYRPKDHNLEKLVTKAEMCDARFAVFPTNTDEEKHLFELLKRAYIDARYKMKQYHIQKEELEYLFKGVEKLRDVTQEVCAEKIKEIGEGR